MPDTQQTERDRLEREVCRNLILHGGQFENRQFAPLFDCLIDMINEGIELDAITVFDELQRRKQTSIIPGRFLGELIKEGE